MADSDHLIEIRLEESGEEGEPVQRPRGHQGKRLQERRPGQEAWEGQTCPVCAEGSLNEASWLGP